MLRSVRYTVIRYSYRASCKPVAVSLCVCVWHTSTAVSREIRDLHSVVVADVRRRHTALARATWKIVYVTNSEQRFRRSLLLTWFRCAAAARSCAVLFHFASTRLARARIVNVNVVNVVDHIEQHRRRRRVVAWCRRTVLEYVCVW